MCLTAFEQPHSHHVLEETKGPSPTLIGKIGGSSTSVRGAGVSSHERPCARRDICPARLQGAPSTALAVSWPVPPPAHLSKPRRAASRSVGCQGMPGITISKPLPVRPAAAMSPSSQSRVSAFTNWVVVALVYSTATRRQRWWAIKSDHQERPVLPVDHAAVQRGHFGRQLKQGVERQKLDARFSIDRHAANAQKASFALRFDCRGTQPVARCARPARLKRRNPPPKCQHRRFVTPRRFPEGFVAHPNPNRRKPILNGFRMCSKSQRSRAGGSGCLVGSGYRNRVISSSTNPLSVNIATRT